MTDLVQPPGDPFAPEPFDDPPPDGIVSSVPAAGTPAVAPSEPLPSDAVPADPAPSDAAPTGAAFAGAGGLVVDPFDVWVRADTRNEMIDELVQLERDEAALHARRTRLLDQYRLFTVDTVHHDQVVGARRSDHPKGWNADVIAQREMTSEIATATRKSENTIAQMFHEAQTLCATLPATMVALTAGDISYRHAAVISSQVQDIPVEARGVFEGQVVPSATRLTVSRLKYQARQVRERMHPDSIESRVIAAVRGRFMEVDPAEDGMAYFTVKLAAVDAVGIYNRYTDTAQGLKTADEERSVGQLRVDAFRDVAINGTIPTDSPNHTPADTCTDGDGGTDGGVAVPVMAGLAVTGITATVVIMVPALTLLGRSDEPAILEGYGPIDLATAMVLAAGAPSWVRVLTHPETGVIMSVGQTRYKVPAAMRMWLRLKDLVCRFPGCNRSAKHCDIDHIVDWAYGGHTSTDNLQHLCPGHHKLKGYTDWSVKSLDNGTLEWVSPAGRTHVTEPEIPLRFTLTPEPAEGVTRKGRKLSSAVVKRRAAALEAKQRNAAVKAAWEYNPDTPDENGWYVPTAEGPTPF